MSADPSTGEDGWTVEFVGGTCNAIHWEKSERKTVCVPGVSIMLGLASKTTEMLVSEFGTHGDDQMDISGSRSRCVRQSPWLPRATISALNIQRHWMTLKVRGTVAAAEIVYLWLRM